MKKIDWLEQFADDYNKKMTKTASAKKSAQQVIVDRSEFPKAAAGNLVTYANAQYKVVDAEFEDEQGPGIILEKVGDFEDGGGEDGAYNTDEKECGDPTVTLADLKNLFDDDIPEIEEETEDATDETDEVPEETVEQLVEDIIDESPEKVVEEPTEDYYGSDKKTAPSKELGEEKKVTDAPYHPTGNPGNDFAVTKTHPDEYEDAAKKTEEQIKNEDSQDRTTVDGYYTWNKNRILDRIVADLTGIKEPTVEEMLDDFEVTEDIPVEVETEETQEAENVLTDAEEAMVEQQEQGIEDQSIEINEIVAPEETAPVNEISNTEPPQEEEPTGELPNEEVVETQEDVLADIEALEDEVIEELKDELFEGLEDEVIEEIKNEVLEELKEELVDEIKEEVVEEVTDNVAEETTDEVNDEPVEEEPVEEELFNDEEIPEDEEVDENEVVDEEVSDDVVEEEEELPEDEEEKEEIAASRKSRLRR